MKYFVKKFIIPAIVVFVISFLVAFFIQKNILGGVFLSSMAIALISIPFLIPAIYSWFKMKSSSNPKETLYKNFKFIAVLGLLALGIIGVSKLGGVLSGGGNGSGHAGVHGYVPGPFSWLIFFLASLVFALLLTAIFYFLRNHLKTLIGGIIIGLIVLNLVPIIFNILPSFIKYGCLTENCLEGEAIQSKNIAICSKTRVNTQNCIENTIKNKRWDKGVSACDKIDVHEYTKWLCYRKIAEKKSSLEICNKIERKGDKETCYKEVALKTSKPSICTKIDDELDKDYCYADIASKLSKPSICTKIDDEFKKENCYEEMYEENNNGSFCDKLKSEREKELCRSQTPY